jgi:D-glycero-alpha-D-manno-heptose 1-phosphate guanylyltransferase
MFEKKKCNVIILSGGFGKRLGSFTKKTPKPLIKINYKPFLEYLLTYLIKFGFYRFYLAVHYKKNKFENFKKKIIKSNKNILLKIINEITPLGTGGAVKNTLNKTFYNDNLVINADTLIIGDFNYYYNFMKKKNFVILGNYLNKNLHRYGIISTKKNTVHNFLEKQKQKKNIKKLINTWVFFFKKKFAYQIFDKFNGEFSLENSIYKQIIKSNYKFYVLKENKPFIDIGIPSDLKKSKSFIKNYLSYGK